MNAVGEPISETIGFYKDGFFGYGEIGDFKYWSFAHFAPIVFLILSIVLLYLFKDRLKKRKSDENFRFILASLCLFFWLSYYWRLLYVGNEGTGLDTFMTKLPLELCEWNCCLTAFMIMKKSKKLFGITFLVTVTFGIIPLLTPVTISNAGPAYFRYYQYWLLHILPFIANFYMLFVHDFKLKRLDIIKAWAFCEVLCLTAVYFNRIIPGANYFYIAQKTDSGSFVNILPDSVFVKWIIYNIIAGVLFITAYSVYSLLKKIKKNR